MASIKTALGTQADLTITLASLANGSGRASTAVDNTTDLYISADVRVKVTTSGTSSSGYVSVYLLRSEDGTSYDDAFAGSDAAYTPINALLLGTILTPATSTYARTFDTAELGLTLPAKWAIGIVNSTGNALSATAGEHEVSIRPKFLSVS
jgi:hypothetical protein